MTLQTLSCSLRFLLLVMLWLSGNEVGRAQEGVRMVGVAKVDITPDYPVRLSGYGSRREESEGVEQRLWAKAMVIGSDVDGPAVVVTVDNCGVPAVMRDEVARRLAGKTKVAPERLALCFSHTHCAPCLTGALVNIFSLDVPLEHQERIDRYSRELTDRLEAVVLAALADRKLAQLSWGTGEVTFARNRRAQGGPMDFSLPVLFVHGLDGKLRGVFTNYACHATTLAINRVHGDWPGSAMIAIERAHPGAVAMVALGCGADQNPNPRGTVELATAHGEAVAREVERVLNSGERRPIIGRLECRQKSTVLPFAPLPTHEEWVKLAQDKRAPIAFHARKNLARLDRGEKLPTELPYTVAAWTFGPELGMVFLPGEVTVDYGLRLKSEMDGARLWVNAYSNDAPCYIPSKRVLDEGGYEGGMAMVYYDRPTKFADDVEDRIVGAVREILPAEYAAKPVAGMPLAKSPTQSWMTLKTKPGLTVELAVAEPLVVDPVAIDWSADGRLWVVEMRDYPMGLDGNWKPGGVVKVLEDTDGDGRHDKATVFLDGLPFPTGLMPWRKGVLICAAPDILYAEDSDGDGRADVVKKLFTGFETANYQARVNSLTLGLDGWVYGANGLLGGKIRGMSNAVEVDLRGRDFRFQPETLVFELEAGVTQQGRCRDDWGNWFGCNNSSFIYQFPLAERYVRRNPSVVAPASRWMVTKDAEPNRVYPISSAGERFNSPESLNHVTSGCGLGIYRDTLLGEEFLGNAFTCEPVHNLVHRSRLSRDGAVFEGRRAEDEQMTEFLAATDNWFRPVQVRTGPDGALWVVDMYRAVIEHPRWIPPEKLAGLDVRAGADRGRIFRVYPTGAKLRPVRNLTKLATPELVAALDSPNGTVRDLVQMELTQRGDVNVAELEGLFRSSRNAAVRVQVLAVLEGVKGLKSEMLKEALHDGDGEVKAAAIRWCEGRFARESGLGVACAELGSEASPAVRYQLALSLGEWDDPGAGEALAVLAARAGDDEWMRAAILSSVRRWAAMVLKLARPGGELAVGLTTTAAATASGVDELGALLRMVVPDAEEAVQGWQLAALLRVQEAFARRKIDLRTLEDAGDGALALAVKQSRWVFEAAHAMAENEALAMPVRAAAVRLYGVGVNDAVKDVPRLGRFLAASVDPTLQKAALETLARTTDERVPELVLAEWAKQGPAMRTAIVAVLLAREPWTLALLEAVQRGVVAPAEVAMDVRQRLANHASERVRQAAAQAFPKRDETRTVVVAKYATVAGLKGDALRGRRHYETICSTCHAYLGQGHEVGPSITTFRSKSVEDFVIAIMDPNAVVEPRYTAYLATLKDGRQVTGVIASETATTLALVQPGGASESLLRSDVASLKSLNTSLMPEGLEQALTPQDLADLIAYLKGNG